MKWSCLDFVIFGTDHIRPKGTLWGGYSNTNTQKCRLRVPNCFSHGPKLRTLADCPSSVLHHEILLIIVNCLFNIRTLFNTMELSMHVKPSLACTSNLPVLYSAATSRRNGVKAAPKRGFSKLLHVPSKVLYLELRSHTGRV